MNKIIISITILSALVCVAYSAVTPIVSEASLKTEIAKSKTTVIFYTYGESTCPVYLSNKECNYIFIFFY